MSGGVVCYIERTPGGAGIRRLRLVAAGLVRAWTAPEARSVSSVDSGPGPALGAARAGAIWINETLEAVGIKRLAAVCVDAEGSICAWLSAPSAEASVVRATILQSAADTDGSGAGVGAARLLTMPDAGGGGGGLMTDTSVQALATLEVEEKPARGLSLRRSPPTPAVRATKQRYAVVAVQDAVVRVLLDELDERGVEVERVVTLWHAMASAWDRSEPASVSRRLVSTDSQGGAVIIVEPTGRLVWAWTRSGELVAGGSMRLAAHARRAEDGAPAPGTNGEALATTDGQRPASAEGEETGGGPVIEFTAADAGRLAVDWLSWSAQLGHCPQRVVCLSVPAVGGEGLGPEALFANLAKAWPGATIDGAVHEDPVGATIARLAGLGPEEVFPTSSEGRAADALPYHLRPREALTDLTSRPGRADRRLYQWVGLTLGACALLVGVLGWQINHSVGSFEEQIQKAKDARKAALKAAEQYVPRVSEAQKPEEMLDGKLNQLREQMKSMKPARPILSETLRVLRALDGVNGQAGATAASDPEDKSDDAPAKPLGRTTLTDLELSTFACKVTLSVPDAATGPTILEKLQKIPGVLDWSGSTPSINMMGPGRAYLLTSFWPEAPAPKPGGKKP